MSTLKRMEGNTETYRVLYFKGVGNVLQGLTRDRRLSSDH